MRSPELCDEPKKTLWNLRFHVIIFSLNLVHVSVPFHKGGPGKADVVPIARSKSRDE